jgi:hypothetical protein
MILFSSCIDYLKGKDGVKFEVSIEKDGRLDCQISKKNGSEQHLSIRSDKPETINVNIKAVAQDGHIIYDDSGKIDTQWNRTVSVRPAKRAFLKSSPTYMNIYAKIMTDSTGLASDQAVTSEITQNDQAWTTTRWKKVGTITLNVEII